MEKLVVIPTYNERENISKMISKVMSLEGGYHLLVVDDGSPDGTGAIVKERQAEFPDRLFLLERSGKLGLGTAYIEGFRWALARPYDAVFEMDCDFSHNPDDLLRLTAELEAGADVAVGSRYSKGVTVVNWPMSRLLMSYCASRYVLVTNDRIVGCGGINFADDKTVGKISWDIIHPDYQGKSLGKQLLEYRIDKLKSIDRVRKITVRTSQLVYKFYQKQGFVLKATHKDYWAKGIDWSMKEIRTPLYFKM